MMPNVELIVLLLIERAPIRVYLSTVLMVEAAQNLSMAQKSARQTIAVRRNLFSERRVGVACLRCNNGKPLPRYLRVSRLAAKMEDEELTAVEPMFKITRDSRPDPGRTCYTSVLFAPSSHQSAALAGPPAMAILCRSSQQRYPSRHEGRSTRGTGRPFSTFRSLKGAGRYHIRTSRTVRGTRPR